MDRKETPEEETLFYNLTIVPWSASFLATSQT